MNILYRLSSSQAKNLLIRATPIVLAIPTPPRDPQDWLKWAKGSLEQYGDLIVSADVEVLRVRLPGDGSGGLAGILGTIVEDPEAAARRLTVAMELVVCVLQPPQPPRHPPGRIQFPGAAIRGQHRWPAVQDTSGTAPHVAPAPS